MPQKEGVSTANQESNKFARLSYELSGKELCEAVYLLTLQDEETWNDLKLETYPFESSGFRQAYEKAKSFKNRDDNKYSDLWRELLNQFQGYFKALWRSKEKNKSDLRFLNEMLSFFEAKGIEMHILKVRTKINEYQYA